MQPDASETVWKGKLLAVTVEQWGNGEREIVEHPGAVTIVAVDDGGNVAFVRQPREATRRCLLELPAGTRDKPDETPLATAQLTPNQQLEPISTGPFELKPCQVIGRSGSSKRCSASPTKQPLANIV